ncbi:MAG: hypothetical protein AAGI24_04240 [Pseudomonadota bacterium]
MMQLVNVKSDFQLMPFLDRIKFVQRSAQCDRRTAKAIANEMSESECWINHDYVVLVRRGEKADQLVHVPELKGRCTYISIRNAERSNDRPWEDFQAIKNQLCGEDSEAIELYPAQSRVVNEANQYHLIVFPPGHKLPFGFYQGDDAYEKQAQRSE